jgi:ribonuclease HI
MSSLNNYQMYVDGACSGNPGPGAYCALIITPDGVERNFSEAEKCILGTFEYTTNNKMEVKAAIAGLALIPDGAHVEVFSDSLYLINTMKGLYKKKTNLDLWITLSELTSKFSTVTWTWVRGHSGNEGNERVNKLVQGLLYT